MAVQLEKMTVHQELLLEMLKDFDAVCRRHHISYQLFAGTALGAVRHHGFIPWDDDIDVILIRSEYQRFFDEAAGDFDPEIYYVQQEHGAHWPMPFSKLRRNNTTCIEKYHSRDPQMHQGVYIDIFPAIICPVTRPQDGCSLPHQGRSSRRRSMRGAMRRTVLRKSCSCSSAGCFPEALLKNSACAEAAPDRVWYRPFWLAAENIKRTFSLVPGSKIRSICALRTPISPYRRTTMHS